jgi:hypothetical protein
MQAIIEIFEECPIGFSICYGQEAVIHYDDNLQGRRKAFDDILATLPDVSGHQALIHYLPELVYILDHILASNPVTLAGTHTDDVDRAYIDFRYRNINGTYQFSVCTHSPIGPSDLSHVLVTAI